MEGRVTFQTKNPKKRVKQEESTNESPQKKKLKEVYSETGFSTQMLDFLGIINFLLISENNKCLKTDLDKAKPIHKNARTRIKQLIASNDNKTGPLVFYDATHLTLNPALSQHIVSTYQAATSLKNLLGFYVGLLMSENILKPTPQLELAKPVTLTKPSKGSSTELLEPDTLFYCIASYYIAQLKEGNSPASISPYSKHKLVLDVLNLYFPDQKHSKATITQMQKKLGRALSYINENKEKSWINAIKLSRIVHTEDRSHIIELGSVFSTTDNKEIVLQLIAMQQLLNAEVTRLSSCTEYHIHHIELFKECIAVFSRMDQQLIEINSNQMLLQSPTLLTIPQDTIREMQLENIDLQLEADQIKDKPKPQDEVKEKSLEQNNNNLAPSPQSTTLTSSKMSLFSFPSLSQKNKNTSLETSNINSSDSKLFEIFKTHVSNHAFDEAAKCLPTTFTDKSQHGVTFLNFLMTVRMFEGDKEELFELFDKLLKIKNLNVNAQGQHELPLNMAMYLGFNDWAEEIILQNAKINLTAFTKAEETKNFEGMRLLSLYNTKQITPNNNQHRTTYESKTKFGL